MTEDEATEWSFVLTGPSGKDSHETSFVPIDTQSLTTAYSSSEPTTAAMGPVSPREWSGLNRSNMGPLPNRQNPRQEATIHSDPASRNLADSASRDRTQTKSAGRIRSDSARKDKMEFAVSAASSTDRPQAGRVDAAGLSKTVGLERQRKGGDGAGSGLGGRVAQSLAGAVDAVARIGLAGQGYTSIPQVEMSEAAAGLHRYTSSDFSKKFTLPKCHSVQLHCCWYSSFHSFILIFSL